MQGKGNGAMLYILMSSRRLYRKDAQRERILAGRIHELVRKQCLLRGVGVRTILNKTLR